MKTIINYVFLLILVSATGCINTTINNVPAIQDFVTVKGLQYERQSEIIYISDFDILDHPVTNL